MIIKIKKSLALLLAMMSYECNKIVKIRHKRNFELQKLRKTVRRELTTANRKKSRQSAVIKFSVRIQLNS